jgi:hypothetical protein
MSGSLKTRLVSLPHPKFANIWKIGASTQKDVGAGDLSFWFRALLIEVR